MPLGLTRPSLAFSGLGFMRLTLNGLHLNGCPQLSVSSFQICSFPGDSMQTLQPRCALQREVPCPNFTVREVARCALQREVPCPNFTVREVALSTTASIKWLTS